MRAFEYEKIDLNSILRSGDDIDLLDELGEDGWEPSTQTTPPT
jgi:hypothetical protein